MAQKGIGKLGIIFAFSILLLGTNLAFSQNGVEQDVDTPKELDVIEDPFGGLQIPPITLPTSITQQQLDPLYTPTVNTLSQLGIAVANGIITAVGFLITLFVGWLVGKGVARVLKRVITKWFESEKLLKLIGMKGDEFKESSWAKVHELIPFTVKWFIFITFFVVAVNMLGIPEATELLAEFSAWVPKLILFLILIVVGFIIVRIALKWIDETKPEMFGEEATVKVIKTIISGIVYAVIFGIGITTLGIGEQIIPIFYWVIPAGIMGILIAMAVGARKIAKYWILSESIKRQGISKGAKIKIKGIEGVIEDVGTTHVKLKHDNKITLISLERFDDNDFDIIEEAKKEKKETPKQ